MSFYNQPVWKFVPNLAVLILKDLFVSGKYGFGRFVMFCRLFSTCHAFYDNLPKCVDYFFFRCQEQIQTFVRDA